ncbi:MAG TPA: hypothetical protein VEA41_11760 [Salinarimonas sp.]|jgi:hypothetical protein|nr:hypothetical protein [Salinarimonas sp.]
MIRAALAVLLALAGPAAAQEPPTPIRFARGASSAVLEGAVIRGERALYGLEARAGQRLAVRVASPERNAVVQIYEPGARRRVEEGVLEVEGRALPGAGEGEDARAWSGALPRSGTYLLVVGGTRGNASYRLEVSVR